METDRVITGACQKCGQGVGECACPDPIGDTPRTDAFEAGFSVDSEKTLADCYDDAIAFARTLERELSAANRAIMMMVEDVNKIVMSKAQERR